jgi:hypothetical protein
MDLPLETKFRCPVALVRAAHEIAGDRSLQRAGRGLYYLTAAERFPPGQSRICPP